MEEKEEGVAAKARKWVQFVRENADEKDVSIAIQWIEEYTEKTGLSLKEAGTSGNELRELEKKGFIAEAKRWFQFVQENAKKDDVSNQLPRIKKAAKKAGVSLKEIGTSEKELEKLKKKGLIARFKMLLEFAKENAKKPSYTDYIKKYVEWIKEDVEKANLTLKEVGTSEKKLKKLVGGK